MHRTPHFKLAASLIIDILSTQYIGVPWFFALIVGQAGIATAVACKDLTFLELQIYGELLGKCSELPRLEAMELDNHCWRQ